MTNKVEKQKPRIQTRNDSLRSQLNLPEDQKINIVKDFDIYRYWMRSYEPYMKGIPIIFFTTPVMNLTSQNSKLDKYFTFASSNIPDIYNSLTAIDPTSSGSINPSPSPFIKLLTNTCKGLEGKDLNSKTLDIGETCSGYKQTLPGSYVDSITGDTVSLKYSCDKDLSVIQLHKIWMTYIEKVSAGIFTPYAEIMKKAEIDYVSTLYYFVLDHDMETILYYSRYVGIAPISNPYSELMANIGESSDSTDLSIEYVYSFKEDLDPEILTDFNKIVQNDYSKLRGNFNTAVSFTIPDYDEYLKGVKVDARKSVYSSQPMICKKQNKESGGVSPKQIYKLVFK